MKKELLEKIKRIVDKASEKLIGIGQYSCGTESVNICVWDGAYSSTANLKKEIFEKCNEDMCLKIVLEALTNDDYVSIRDIEYTEYKIIDMLTDNCILDGNSYWIDYEDGMLHVIDSEEGEWYEIDLTDCKLVKSIEGTVEKEMELHIKYDDLLFKIKEVEGEAICDVLEIDDNDFDKDQYIRELEEKVNKQSVLIKLLRDN